MPKGGREFTHYATFLHKKQRSEGACRLFVSLQGPRGERQGITERSDVIPQGPPRVPTGTPSVDFALQKCQGWASAA